MPIPVGSTAFPPPLPVSPNKVSTVLMSAPVNPGDILVVQQATMQANTPVLALRVAKLDSTQFIVDMGVDPPTIKSIAPGVAAVWTAITPTVTTSPSVAITTTTLTGSYLISNGVVLVRAQWVGTFDAAIPLTIVFSGFPQAKASAILVSQVLLTGTVGSTPANSFVIPNGDVTCQDMIIGGVHAFRVGVTTNIIISGSYPLA